MNPHIRRISLIQTAIVALLCLAMTACDKDDNEKSKSSRTVLVYMSGENSLSSITTYDLEEMKIGSEQISDSDNLIVYVDRTDKNELPWLGRVKDGIVIDTVTIADMQISDYDELASDPHIFEQVLTYAYSHYPANDGYGLVLWGHADGWVIEDSIAYSRAYGVDNGTDSPDAKLKSNKNLNIPTIRRILEKQPHLKFIFADCCLCMCLELVYELRNVTDYVIATPAEIPDDGAPYHMVVPDMFDRGDFAGKIVDSYFAAYKDYLLLSAIKTSEMDTVATATRNVLKAIYGRLGTEYPDLTGLIHYFYYGGGSFNKEDNLFYDAGDFIQRYATAEEYQAWKQALDQAIVTKTYAEHWETEKHWNTYYADFTMTPERAHCVSMYIPKDPKHSQSKKMNEDLKKFLWYYAVWDW